MIWVTGDKHGDFSEVDAFCRMWQTEPSDVLVILGDAGINYYQDARATALKQHLAQLPITFFCIHGNHEARPETLPGYALSERFDGQVYVDARYPNQLFPVDGALYTLGSQRVLVAGGAYSVDKYYRLLRHWAWFEDEQPSEAIKFRTETALERAGWQVDAVFSHTCPFSRIPREKHPPMGVASGAPDLSTEVWLERLRRRLDYGRWYAGHFHMDLTLADITFLYHDFVVFDA